MRLSSQTTIDGCAQEAIRCEGKKWRDLLWRFLDIIKFLAKHNMALRGHREGLTYDSTANKGNFLDMVEFLGTYDACIREHITRLKLGGKMEVTYMSPLVQNEIISLLGNQVRKRIMEQVKDAKYYCIIFDCTTDISHREQMSQVIRYVKIDGPQVTVVESFVDFIQVAGKKAEDLTRLILDKLEADGLNIQDCRGQAYDNAAVMSGVHSGVQARIREINPDAQFVPCSNHSLNLAVVHAAAEGVGSITFFGIVEEIFVFFSSSSERWNRLTAATTQGVKRAIETRWSARHDAVSVIRNYFPQILDVFDDLISTGDSRATREKAAIVLESLHSFTFLSYLGFWSEVLREVNIVHRYLQTEGIDLHKSSLKLSALRNWLVDSREELVSSGLTFARGLCEELGIEIPPRRRRKRRYEFDEDSEDAALSFEQELKREMFACSDRISSEIDSRFKQLHDLDAKFSFLKPAVLFNGNSTCDLTSASPDINSTEFLVERKRLQEFLKVCPENEKSSMLTGSPLELLRFIKTFNLDICVPNIVIGLRIFLTIAISSAGCERTFSKLKLIKTYLRSTMSQLRLSNLAMLSIEHELCDDIDMKAAIDEFAMMKARKKKF